MKPKPMLFLPLMNLLLFSSCSHAQNQGDDFSKLYSLVGAWKMETTKGSIVERWQKLNDSTLKSLSYKINGKDTIILERAELVKRAGKIQYIPTVKDENNNEAVVFMLIKKGNDSYVFENAGHDFPQRIVYMLPQNNSLHAWIEGNAGGNFKKIDYRYNKVSTE